MPSKYMLVAAVAIAALFPVSAAVAKPGNGNGNANGHAKQDAGAAHGNGNGNANANGHAQQGTDTTLDTSTVTGPPGLARPRAGSRNHVARGVVASVDPTGGLVGVTVTAGPGGTNFAARVWRDQTVQFNVSTAFLSVTDVNGDGTGDLNDIKVGDRVQVQAFLVSTDAQPYPARRLTAHWPAPVDTATDTTETETTTETTTDAG